MDLPGAIVIHGCNEDRVDRYKRYIQKFGGLWYTIRGRGDYGRYLLIFPPSARVLDHREIREEDDPDGAYTQTDIAFDGDYYLTLYRNKKIGHPQEEHNRVVVPLVELEEALSPV